MTGPAAVGGVAQEGTPAYEVGVLSTLSASHTQLQVYNTVQQISQ